MRVLARDVMQKDVKTVRSDLLLADLERRFLNDAVSGFPVIDADGAVRGVVSGRDVLMHVCEERSAAETSRSFYNEDPHMEFASVEDDWVSAEVGKRADRLTVSDIMQRNVISVTPDTPLRDVAALMTERKVHRVLVIEDRRLLGIVSSSDIVRTCGNDMIDILFTAPEILDF